MDVINSSNTIIYILCNNEKKLLKSKNIYNKYSWARPILLKNNDNTYKNIFWKQLKEIQNEWFNCNMVGILSFSSYKKIDLKNIDKLIENKLFYPFSYYYFFDTYNNINRNNITRNNNKYLYFEFIWNKCISELNLFDTINTSENYWMCKPILMINFIDWYLNCCLTYFLKNNFNIININYNSYFNKLKQKFLIKYWLNELQYINFPFILKKLNKSFFITNYSIVFFIYNIYNNDDTLINIKNFYSKNNIITMTLNPFNFNLINYINEKANNYNLNPIIISNTLFFNHIMIQLKKTNIPIFWYINEKIELNISKKNYLLIYKPNFYFIFKTNAIHQEYINFNSKFKKNYLIIDDSIDTDINKFKLILTYSPLINIHK